MLKYKRYIAVFLQSASEVKNFAMNAETPEETLCRLGGRGGDEKR